MKKADNLTDVNFWVNRQGQKLNSLPPNGKEPSWLKHVKEYLPKDSNSSCIEIGVVPGLALLYIATHYFYQSIGIDFSPRIRELDSLFRKQGVKAEFIEADFLSWTDNRKFDFVYSCGFIEHFDQYQNVIKKHWELVNQGGILLLTIPTLTPFQNWIRKIYYEQWKWEEIQTSHNFNVNPKALLEEILRLPECELIKSSYISEMRIWFNPKEKGIKKDHRILFLILKVVDLVLRLVGISSSWYSPEFLVVVRKKST